MSRACYTIEDVRDFILSKGATLHDTIYPGFHKKLKLTCSNGHNFSQPFSDLKRTKSENLCPYCSGAKVFSVEEYISLILKRCQLKLIGDPPSKMGGKLKLICKNNHYTTRNLYDLKYLKHCGICYNNKRSQDALIKFNDLIKSKNAKLLTSYASTRDKVKIECDKKHIFEARVNKLTTGGSSWCPKCSKSCGKSEKKCLDYFESIFKKEFVKTRSLPWLKTNQNTPLELDGYCEELKIAFEYQGEQHYKEVIFKGKSNVRWKTPLYDDLKVTLCKENNVKLFIIPYFELKNLKECVSKQILDFQINI